MARHAQPARHAQHNIIYYYIIYGPTRTTGPTRAALISYYCMYRFTNRCDPGVGKFSCET
jgi:hypothetical protein